MRILLTNDDGINAQGLQTLRNVLASAHEVLVVAPAENKSGAGHSFTAPGVDLKVDKVNESSYRVWGTPVDCVKFAATHIDSPSAFDCVVSGINDADNSGSCAYYSGTLAAAREAALWSIPAIAFSCSFTPVERFYEWAHASKIIIEELTELRDNPGVYFNVNFPFAPNGIRFTKQSLSFWKDRYEKMAEGVYRLYGTRQPVEDDPECDSRALIEGKIAITPMGLDESVLHARSQALTVTTDVALLFKKMDFLTRYSSLHT